ncbi:hypothetical protein J23TS9_35420 [Paenibacillus sp. J23TS9]|nr:hypothetical protein J23TS9_35420 [Paenibacillus sp. J23TS9]
MKRVSEPTRYEIITLTCMDELLKNNQASEWVCSGSPMTHKSRSSKSSSLLSIYTYEKNKSLAKTQL